MNWLLVKFRCVVVGAISYIMLELCILRRRHRSNIINNDKSKSKLKKVLIDPKTNIVSNFDLPHISCIDSSLGCHLKEPYNRRTVSLDSDNDKDGARPVKVFAADPGTSPVTLVNWYSRPSTFRSSVFHVFS